MNKMPMLSIIVPVYNAEEYLPKCLDSILAQDFKDYEVIMVDDGSTDSSGMICDRYASAHSLFRSIHKANGGHTSARKCGLEACRGEYVAFVDSDDWIAPDMYSKMCRAVDATHAEMVFCPHIAAMPQGEEVVDMPFQSGFYNKEQMEKEIYPFMLYSGTYFKYGISPNLWNKLFRRELLWKHLMHVPNDVIVGEDTLTSYSCILEADSAYIINEPLYYYRTNADSLTHRVMPDDRLIENHKLFQTLHDVIDLSSHPYMGKQLDYYFVHQSLLTLAPVFQSIACSSGEFRKIFIDECRFPLIRQAFARVSIRDITGIHNKLYAFCIRHRLPGLFRMILEH